MRVCAFSLPTLLSCLIAAPLASATTLLPNDILVTGIGTVGQGLIRIDRETGAQTLISAGSYGDFQIVGQTVYASAGNSIVVIDADTGAVETIASGGLLDTVPAWGVAVAPNGDVFFAGGGIVKIDAVTHQQSLLLSGEELDLSYTRFGLIQDDQNSRIVDLEISSNGKLYSLANLRSLRSWIADVDLLSGQLSVLFDGFSTGTSWGVLASGLGIRPDGVLVTSDGGPNSTGIAAFDPTTGVASLIGSNVVGAVGIQSVELLFSDVASDSLGMRWIIGDAAANPLTGLFRDWRLEDDATAFSAGQFNEIQIVPIPEPSTALLTLFGLAGLSCRRRQA